MEPNGAILRSDDGLTDDVRSVLLASEEKFVIQDGTVSDRIRDNEPLTAALCDGIDRFRAEQPDEGLAPHSCLGRRLGRGVLADNVRQLHGI
jgi:hypothetical protein